MPKLEYFLVSESFATDQDSNLVSIFNILEEITAVLPHSFCRLVATSSWNLLREDQGRDFQVMLRIYSPTGEPLKWPGDITVNFTAERARHRIHNEIRGLPLNEAGDYRFEVLLNGAHHADHIVSVHETKKET